MRYGFVVAVVTLGIWAIVSDWHEIGPDLARIGLPMALASLVIDLLGCCASMWTWRVLLAGLGSPLPFGAASRVLFVGQLGKYLPGSVWPVLAQMEMGTSYNVPRSRSGAASLVNMGVSVLGAFLAAAVFLPLSGGSSAYLWFAAAIPVFLVCLHPKVLNYLLARAFRLGRRPPLEQPLTGRVIAVAVAWSVVSWLLYGLAVWLLATRVGFPASGYPLAVGAYALSWALGFLFIPAPAGGGVREVVLIPLLMRPHGMTYAAAYAITIVWRAVTIVGDLMLAGLAMTSRKGRVIPAGADDADEEPASVLGSLDQASAPDPASPAPHR
ncbi:MAG TPA: lysylphosphatidylglycerol synthase transmembrane domain-containing protein [Trebonia sp.]|nr:lysylphosphatidylglycerol synthase transmembrane domain-containing protein [Trebonia sp.]